MATESDLAKLKLQAWGRQTIAFAMSLRAIEIGKPIEEKKRALRDDREKQKKIAAAIERTRSRQGKDS